MARTERAEFVREVRADEEMGALVDEVKGLTYEHFREYALVLLADGRKIVVRGGPYGIDFDRGLPNDPFGRDPDGLFIEVRSKTVRVRELVFHTPPNPTGPSDDDLEALKLLGQESSMLYELFGPAEGTEIRPKGR